VLYGVRREFADDEGDRAGDVRRRRVAPFLHPPDGVTPGELRTARGGGELRRERLEFTLRHVSRGGGFCQHGLREDARREGKRYSFEDVLLISEVVPTSSARKDYDDCTAKYGRYGIPIYLVVDPYAQEVVLHTQPTATGYIAAHTHAYGTGKLPIPLADGRTFTLDLDELPRPEPEGDTR
jgi:hypothetical protein